MAHVSGKGIREAERPLQTRLLFVWSGESDVEHWALIYPGPRLAHQVRSAQVVRAVQGRRGKTNAAVAVLENATNRTPDALQTFIAAQLWSGATLHRESLGINSSEHNQTAPKS